ncbi:DUF484 family protein [Falsihalocynthiibacter sp. BN13B15]|uniref:DUF484 family protein n=1 Tax=Falsihalocynthiibacter sp. BN13B15 TaxID=3240871 RepID=UPI00350F714F
MSNAILQEDLREKIMTDPEFILEDKDVMRALVAANEKALGGNIVDLRGIAMDRLEARLDRLEDTHRSVIAAAYENLAGTNQVHRAVLKLLDPTDFEAFLQELGTGIAEILRVDAVRLVLESVQKGEDPVVKKLGHILTVAEPGFVDTYLKAGRQSEPRPVTLRQYRPADDEIYGTGSEYIRSEAALKLDFGNGRLPGLLLLGSEDPHMFKSDQGTDLLAFFAGTFERAMARWLS